MRRKRVIEWLAPRLRSWWPIAAAAVGASLVAVPLLLTPDPFIGSGTDVVAIEYPLRAFAHERLNGGDLPLWNPYHLGGVPFQTGVHGYLSPSFWTTWVLPAVLDMKVGIVLHLALAAAGAAWLVRRSGCAAGQSGWGHVLAGVTYGLSGFMMSHLFAGHPRLVFTAAYLPWVVGLLDGVIRATGNRPVPLGGEGGAMGKNTQTRPSPSPSLEGRGVMLDSVNSFPRGLTAAAIGCGLMLLCGHFQVVFIGLFGTGCFVVLNRLRDAPPGQFTRRASRALVVMAAVVGLAALLAMVQLLPAAEALSMSQRSGGGPAFAAGFASSPINLVTLVWPNFFGNFVESAFFGHWAYWESLAYLGLVPLVLLAAAPMVMPWREWLPAAAVAVLGLVLSVGAATPLFEGFARLVPGAGLFRGAGRYVLLFTLFGAMLAGQVLDRWIGRSTPLSRRQMAVVWALPVTALAVAVWVWSRSATQWQQLWADLGRAAEIPVDMTTENWQDALLLARGDALRAVVIVTAAAGLLWGGGRLGRRRTAGAAIALLAIVDLCAFGHRFLGTGERGRVVWPDDLVAFLAQNHEPGLRIIDDPVLFCPGRGGAIGVGHVGGHDTLLDETYVRYMNQANGKRPDQFVTYVRTFENTPMHDRLGARYLLAAGPLERDSVDAPRGFDDWKLEGRFGGVWVYRNPAPQPRVFITHAAEVAEESAVFARMADPAFDLRGTVLVEAPLPAAFTMQAAPSDASSAAEGTARIVSYEPDRVEVAAEAASAGSLVLSDNWHSGWRAWVDGRAVPVVRANRVMRAVPVPAGRHRVVFEYRPIAFSAGSAVSVVALVGLLWWRFWRWGKRVSGKRVSGLFFGKRRPPFPKKQS